MSGVFGVDEQRRLLMLARQALEAHVRGLRMSPPDLSPPFDRRWGAFVTIHAGDALRGCLGRIDGDWPIGRVISYLAKAVADADPRFTPVAVDELPRLTIEISVLTPPREGRADDVQVGTHGLIVEHEGRRGLLLPQVAVEHRWSATEFLHYTCIKAGLSPDAWQRGARLYLFEAEVFSEPRREAEQ